MKKLLGVILFIALIISIPIIDHATVSNQTNRVSYTGNGTTKNFAVSFPFHSTSDLVVISTVTLTGAQSTLTYATDYTVGGTQDGQGHYPNGGTVYAVTAPASTVTLTIYRDPALTQNVDLVEGDPLPVESAIESPFDRLTLIDQRLKERLDRSLTQAEGDSTNISRLPSKIDRASKYLGFDTIGNPVAMSATDTLQGTINAADIITCSPWVDVRCFGAKGDGVTDDTAAIQSAISVGKNTKIPCGTYKITSAITISTIDQIIEGDGMNCSIISLSGVINGFITSGATTRFQIKNLQIIGNSSTLNAIDVSASTNMYFSNFENLNIYTGGKCIYAPNTGHFDFIIKGGICSSYNDNGFEVSGGNATTFVNTYAGSFTTGKAGYRVYSSATLIGATGINSGDYWGLFGSAVAKGDATNQQYRITMIGCHFEDWNVDAIKFRYDGTATLIDPQFVPKAAGTYETSIYIEYNSSSFYILNGYVSSKGSTKTKLSDIFCDNCTAPTSHNFNHSPSGQYDLSGTGLVYYPNISVGQITSTEYGFSLRNLITSNKIDSTLSFGTTPAISMTSSLQFGTTTYATLTTTAGPSRSGVYCSDCNVASPCTSGGGGAFAFNKSGLGTGWNCPY